MRKVRVTPSKILRNDSREGETIEMKIVRIMNNNEPITDTAPIIYTERKDGVLPEYNIRTDSRNIAMEAMDVVDKTNKAKRMDNIKKREEANKPPNEGNEQSSANTSD